MNNAIDIIKQAEQHKKQLFSKIDQYNREVAKSEFKSELHPVNADINRMQNALKSNDVKELKRISEEIQLKYANKNS